MSRTTARSPASAAGSPIGWASTSTALRVGFVALALVTPTVVIAYVVAALVVPERRPDQVRVRAQRVHLGRIPHPVLVIGAIIAVAIVVDDAWWLEPFPAALALIAVGVWLIAQGRDDESNRDDGLPWPGSTAPDGAVSPPSDAESVDDTASESVPLDADPTQLLDATERFVPKPRAPDHRASFLPRPRPGGPAAPARTSSVRAGTAAGRGSADHRVGSDPRTAPGAPLAPCVRRARRAADGRWLRLAARRSRPRRRRLD